MYSSIWYVKSTHTIDFKCGKGINSQTGYWADVWENPMETYCYLSGRYVFKAPYNPDGLWHLCNLCKFLSIGDYSKSKRIA